jgi:hypothetical protein
MSGRKSDDKRGQIQGPQKHAEGQHGERTHSRFLEQIHDSPPSEEDNIIARHRDGEHKLDEDRQQHDEAEKNSERNRKRR